MQFGVLAQDILPTGELRDQIETLIERKKLGDKLKREPRIDVISDFIESEMTRLALKAVERREESHLSSI